MINVRCAITILSVIFSHQTLSHEAGCSSTALCSSVQVPNSAATGEYRVRPLKGDKTTGYLQIVDNDGLIVNFNGVGGTGNFYSHEWMQLDVEGFASKCKFSMNLGNYPQLVCYLNKGVDVFVAIYNETTSKEEYYKEMGQLINDKI